MFIEDISKIKQALKNLDSLKKHLEIFPIDSKEKSTGNTLLHQTVCDKISPQVINFLIAQGANPYIKNNKNQRVIELKDFQDHVKHLVKTSKPDPSKKTYLVYLAGPEVFLPYALSAGVFIKAQTLLFNIHHLKKTSYNIKGLYPFDSDYTPKNRDFHEGIEIYKGNLSIMNRSHAVLANMVKFRGPGMDGGTAFEMGYMSAQGKPVIGYYEEKPYFDNPKQNRAYTEKVTEDLGGLEKRENFLYDNKGLSVESFGMSDNLMMVASTLSDKETIHIAESSWEALFLLKKKLDMINES